MKEAGLHSYGGLRFEIRKHWATNVHFDFRAEWNGILLDWAMPDEPSGRVGEEREAREMEDHALANLMFEGIHKTGLVMVWDRGLWKPHGDVLAGLESGCLKFALDGEKIHGVFALTRRHAATKSSPPVWTLRKEEELSPKRVISADVLANWSNSVLKWRRTKEQIARDWYGTKREHPNLFDSLQNVLLESEVPSADKAA